ncbi:Aldo/keto reductase [Atractiella rhizophila]|nr:Aldo/keto reductase [Atractiella rhizophila]
MSIVPKSQLNVILGAMTFGKEGASHVRVSDLETISKILDVFQSHGHAEVDTSMTYGHGASEEVLGELEWQKRGLKVATKIYPSANSPFWANKPVPQATHSIEDLKKFSAISFNRLKTDAVDVYYLHAPDRKTPFEETMKGIDELYRQGKFKRFGISNFMSWEVAELVGICERYGYVKPSVYQGLYHAINRNAETELIHCLRKFNISLYIFNPLAGGFFTDSYTKETEVAAGSRFDSNTEFGPPPKSIN